MDVKIVGEGSLIDSDAINQIYSTMKKYGEITQAVAMPDLHPGPGYPNGCAFASTSCIPHIIGGDIGCGMTLFDVGRRPLKMKQVLKRLKVFNLNHPFPAYDKVLCSNGIPESAYDE